MKDTIFVLALLGAFLAGSGAFANWSAGQFPSNYRLAHLMLAKWFAIGSIVLLAIAIWAKLTQPRAGTKPTPPR